MATNPEYTSVELDSMAGGILITFTHIPQDTTEIKILAFDVTDDYALLPPTQTFITGKNIERVKESGLVFFPFVQEGHQYGFRITSTLNDSSQTNCPLSEGEEYVIAFSTGIYLINENSLTANKERTLMTLENDPEFSLPVEYASPKYHYEIISIKHDYLKISNNFDEKTLEYNLNEIIAGFGKIPDRQKEMAQSVTSLINAYCSVIHEGLTWNVPIASNDIRNKI